MPEPRLLIISPVRNERGHIAAVAESVAAQTLPPARWVVLDDGSDDGTLELLRELEQRIPFMRVVSSKGGPPARDRLAMAAAPRAFNRALATEDWREFDYIGKLDGDVELPRDYFERLVGRFQEQESLGIAGGRLVEHHGDEWRMIPIPAYHVHGAVKLYSSACFAAIGGVDERLGWDTIDETYARIHGFETRSFEAIVARHHRHVGSADGRLRGRARHGECAYIVRYGAGWVALRSLKVALTRPYGLSGVAFFYGYARAAARRAPKVEDERFRRFVRRELRARLLRPLLAGPIGARASVRHKA